MSGITASVLLRSPFTVSDTSRVTEVLRELFTDVQGTRKGRTWTFTAEGAVASIDVISTAKHIHDFEDDLLANDLLPEDATEALLISFPIRRDAYCQLCSDLACRLTESFNGINCGLSR